ncbi:MAG: tetratricopeptide repeat protein [Alloacidobacterium sp.]|jgi:tetratricopeptide (TPR) repeat protein
MKRRVHHALIGSLVSLLAASPALAEVGYITVQVQDAQRRPVRGVDIGVEGIGGSRLSGDDGKAQLALAKSAAPNDWITLQILHSPPSKDFVIISPWDYRVQVPSFAEKPENFIRVVVVERGDRAALENGSVITALAAKINTVKTPKVANPQTPPSDPKQALATVAGQYGLSTTDVDTAIRSWGKKTTDHYEAGMAALYENNYTGASTALTGALEQRQQKLASGSIAPADQKNVADAALFLGTALFQQGKYSQAANAFQTCLSFRPNDPLVLGNLAVSLEYAGNYPQAEQFYRQVFQSEKVTGPDSLNFAADLTNYGVLLRKKGDYAQAENLYHQALSIQQKHLPPDDPALANTFNNLGALLNLEGRYDEAEPLLRRALAIDEKTLGPNDPQVATDFTNLAALLENKGDKTSAESMLRRALAIDEKALGPDHPEVAKDLNNLAQLIEQKGDRAIAESLYRRALAINEAALGPGHPEVATDLNNLGLLLSHEGKLAEADQLYRRALAIDEKALGPDHLDVARDLNNLGSLLQDQHKYTEAEAMYRRAIAIDEKVLGPDHPITKGIRGNLASLPPHASPSQP